MSTAEFVGSVQAEGSKIMPTITRRAFSGGLAVFASLRATASIAQTEVTPAEARAIAKEAYIYGFPLVDN